MWEEGEEEKDSRSLMESRAGVIKEPKSWPMRTERIRDISGARDLSIVWAFDIN